MQSVLKLIHREESLTSSSSQEPRATGKLAAMFSSGNEEPGNHFKSSMFKKKKRTLIRQIWEDLFLKAIKTICSVRQDLNSRYRNIKLDLAMIVSVSFSNKLLLKDWFYRTHNTDMLNLDENKFVYKKKYQ